MKVIEAFVASTDGRIPVIAGITLEGTAVAAEEAKRAVKAGASAGLLVGYGCIAPEPLLDLIKAGEAKDYQAAHAIHERLLPVTKAVYHRGSHMEGTVALKIALAERGILDHATVRSPLLPLEAGAEEEIRAAMRAAGLGRVA